MCHQGCLQLFQITGDPVTLLTSLVALNCIHNSVLLQDTKALRETRVLQEFYTMLSQDSARAFYGPGHIRAANELGAIGTLLITDTVLLVHDVQKVSLKCLNFPFSFVRVFELIGRESLKQARLE